MTRLNINDLDLLQKSFLKHQGKEFNQENRAALYKLIKDVSEGNNMPKLFRNDDKENKIVNFYMHPDQWKFGMAPEVSIMIADDKIHVCSDGLEGSIYGLFELLSGD